jgi:hypothetical protein
VPTRLDPAAVSRAIDHLCKYGDTDVFPHLAEIVFLIEERDKIIQEISELDLDTFNPTQAIETISPKSRFGFRIVHQFQILETLLFTACVIEIAPDLELLKRPLFDFGPFAYRFSGGNEASLFVPAQTYRDWLEWQAAVVKDEIINLTAL